MNLNAAMTAEHISQIALNLLSNDTCRLFVRIASTMPWPKGTALFGDDATSLL
jgi:hypothetical protein